MIRPALLSLVAFLLLVTPSSGATASYVPTDVPIVYAECPGYPQALGCVYDGRIYVADHEDRETRLHELGHVWDARTLTDADRTWFARLLGMPGRSWFEASGEASPGERFADAFALCASGYRVTRLSGGDTGYGYVPRPRTHRRICNAIAVLDLVR